jgi:hypothetical protein
MKLNLLANVFTYLQSSSMIVANKSKNIHEDAESK